MSPLTPESLKEDIDEIKRDIKSMAQTMNTIAVQDERIKHVEAEQRVLWSKHDVMEQKLDQAVKWQASCPRGQIKTLWFVVVPMGLVLFGMFLDLIRLAHEIGAK